MWRTVRSAILPCSPETRLDPEAGALDNGSAMPPEWQQDSTLREIVPRLVDAVDPEKLILFGSRATGGGDPDSNYDILIVKAEPDPALW